MDAMELAEKLDRFKDLSPEKKEELIEALDDLTQVEQNRIIASISGRNVRMAVVIALNTYKQTETAKT